MESHPLRSSALVLAGAACLSLSAIVVKIAAVDSATTAFLRCAIAVVVLVPLAWAELRARRRAGVRPESGTSSRRGWWLAAAAGTALGVDYILWTASIFEVGAGIATVLINVQVLVLPLLALVVEKEPIGRRFWWALPAMLIGIGLVGGLAAGATGQGNYLLGTVAGVIAGVCYGIYLYLTRRAAQHQPGLTVTHLCVATAAATIAAGVLSPLGSGLHLTGLTTEQWLLMIVLAVVGQVISWLLVHRGSAGMKPRQTAALLLVQPVIALVLAAVILAELPTWSQWLGVALVLAAVAVANRVIPLGRSAATSG